MLPKVFDFYQFRSQPNFEVAETGIQTISANQFDEFVKQDSKHWPVIVQLYEDSCFLCFLMRPLMQTICLDREKYELAGARIVRLNVEENDFPEGLAMSRGTPQFYLWRDGKGKKVSLIGAIYYLD